MRNLFVVTASKIIRTPLCSFRFMMESGMPRKWIKAGQAWGMLVPFEKPEYGQDTNIYIFKDGRNVLTGAFNSTPEDHSELQKILTEDWLPEGDIILLMEEATLKNIEPCLLAHFGAYECHRSGMEIATA